MKKTLVTGFVSLALMLPVAVSAQTEASTSILALLRQIISLQTSLIETLQNQLAQLSTQALGSAATTHKCAVVSPPLCSTTLSATYDSYNCVTAYSCKTAATTTAETTTSANTSTGGCSYAGATYAEGKQRNSCVPSFPNYLPASSCGFTFMCRGGTWVPLIVTPQTCPYNGEEYPNEMLAEGFASVYPGYLCLPSGKCPAGSGANILVKCIGKQWVRQ